jgi:mono/diheme cytochrome c family protein
MTVVFPPPLDLTLLLGVALLAVGGIGFLAARRLGGNSAGRLLVMARIPAVIGGVVLTMSAFFAATPETNLPNPIPRTVDSVAIGGQVYLNSCASCHGADARGGGPQAPTTPVQPPALVGPGSHLAHHTDGDLHYVIGNGLPGGMPAWKGTLTDDQIWHVINYLRSLQEGAVATP